MESAARDRNRSNKAWMASEDQQRLLFGYIRDHHAASAGGLALVQRCRRNNEGTEFEEAIATLSEAIADDRRVLENVMASLDVSPSQAKVLLVRAGEMVGRVKANGRIVHYSPSSRVVELEALASGIVSQRQLWRVLSAVAASEPSWPGTMTVAELDEVEARVTKQLHQALDLHRRASEVAFVGGAPQA